MSMFKFIVGVMVSCVRYAVYMIIGALIIGGVAALYIVGHSPYFWGILWIGASGYAVISLWTTVGMWLGWLFGVKKMIVDPLQDLGVVTAYDKAFKAGAERM